MILKIGRACVQSLRLFRKVRKLLSGRRVSKSNAPIGKVFVFNPVQAAVGHTHLNIDLFIGRLLAEQGATVYILIDDGTLNHWDAVRVGQRRHCHTANGYDLDRLTPYQLRFLDRVAHELKLRALLRAYRHPNLVILRYSAIIDEEVLSTRETTDNDRTNAERSVVRVFETADVNLNDPEQQRYYELSIKDCKVSRSVGRFVVNRIKPDLFVTSHGFYSTWGGCYDEVREASIPTAVYEIHPYRNGYLELKSDNREIADQEEYRECREHDLSPAQLRKTDEILQGRVTNNDDRVGVYFSRFGGRFRTVEVPRHSSDQKVFVAFPNVAWDVTSAYTSSVFDGIMDWLETTVAVIRQSVHYLIIRFHPSETSELAGAKPLRSLISERIADIEQIKNVILIDSDTNVNSYQLAKESADVALVFNGTLGHELPYLGVPVIGASDGRFSESFVFKPESREQYLDWLRNPDLIVNSFRESQSYRLSELHKYVFYCYLTNAYRLSILDTTNSRGITYTCPPEERDLSRLMKKFSTMTITNNEPVVRPGAVWGRPSRCEQQ